MVQEETLNSNTNATIVCGHTIGGYAFIGAGTVVTKDVPDYALAMGSPARIAGWVCECGYQIKFKEGFAVCNDFRKQYRQSEEGVKCVEHGWRS